MNTLFRYIFGCTCALVFLLPYNVLASDAISEFTSNIVVQEDGTFDVIETIVYDFGDEIHHGIFRVIPLEHVQEASVWYKKRYIEVQVSSVAFDDKIAQYTINEAGDELTIKIGDPDVTITGLHTYKLEYSVAGGLTYTDSAHPDLYWNVTGNDWPGNIASAKATVKGPSGVFRANRACYRGQEGEAKACERIFLDAGVVEFSALGLLSGEGMTIAQSLNGSVLQKSVVERIPFYFSIVPLLFLLFGLLMYKGYRFNTAHNNGDTVIAQYEPYPGVLPMYSGVVVDGKLDPKDITAGILYLAQQGFLKISKTQRKVMFLFEVDDYEITLLRSVTETPTAFHKEILSLLFTHAEAGEMTSLAEMKKNTSQQKQNYKTLQSLKSAITKDLLNEGFYESAFTWKKNYVIAGGALLGLSFFLSYKYAGDVGIFLLVFLGGFGAIVFGSMVYRRRTKKGYEAKRHIQGFKEFLSVTDKERFAFHNAPEKNPEQFMEYLPYAVALGVEDKWAEVFKDMSIASPAWYEDTAHGTFAASSLTRDIGAFSNSFASSTGTSPSSGGGSSGGGSGGGGGGSW